MTAPTWRDLLRKIVLIGSLGLIGMTLLAAMLALTAQIASYGPPLKLLVSLGLIVAIAVGFRYVTRRRNGSLVTWEHSWWMAGLIVSAVFLLANQLIVRGIAVGIWDADGEMFPFQVLVSDFARSGRFIHWDPWSDGGLPLAIDPSVGAFSPLNLAIGLLTGGTSAGFRIYWLLVWSLGGFGILMLARHLSAPAWAGAVVAIGFLFSGVYTGNAEHTSCVVAFSFLPLIIWRLDAAIVTQKLRPAAEAGALWGLSALSGYPALTIMSGFFCALWATGRLVFGEGRQPVSASTDISRPAPTIRAQFVLLIRTLTILLVVGMAVLAPPYYAFFAEGAGTNARSGPLSREVAVLSNALDPGALSTLASPYLAALKAANQFQGGKLWPSTDLSLASIYSGAAVTVFALLSILARPRDRWRWWLIILAGLSLSCALGGALPLRGWLYDWIYPMRFFRHPALFGFYFVFTISVMALLGLRDIQNAISGGADPVWRRFKVASLCCALAAFVAFLTVIGYLGAESPISLNRAPGRWLIVSGTWLSLLGLAMLLGFWPDSVRLRYLPPILLALVAGDSFLTHAVSQGHMFSTEPEAAARWQSLDRRHSAALDLTENGLMREQSPCVTNDAVNARPQSDPHSAYPCPFSDQLITKMPVLESYSTLPNPFLHRITRHDTLREMALGSERVWFSAEAVQVPVTKESFAVFERIAELLRASPLVVHSVKDMVNGAAESGDSKKPSTDPMRIEQVHNCSLISIRVLKYDPDELYFETNCPSDGWLLVTDRWGPAWRAQVNGESTEVLGGNFVFRAIRVRAGENSIRFTYHPPLFPWLLILSWATLSGIAIWSILAARAKSRNDRIARSLSL